MANCNNCGQRIYWERKRSGNGYYPVNEPGNRRALHSETCTARQTKPAASSDREQQMLAALAKAQADLEAYRAEEARKQAEFDAEMAEIELANAELAEMEALSTRGPSDPAEQVIAANRDTINAALTAMLMAPSAGMNTVPRYNQQEVTLRTPEPKVEPPKPVAKPTPAPNGVKRATFKCPNRACAVDSHDGDLRPTKCFECGTSMVIAKIH